MKSFMLCLAVLLTSALVFTVRAAVVEEAPTQVTLEKRTENGPYGASAYSFRQATQNPAIHKNYVDLLLNGCGLIHVSPVSGMETRVVDLGEVSLAEAPDTAPEDADWYTESIEPIAGHVYLQEITQHGQSMTVKFHIDEVNDDSVTLTWMVVQPLRGPGRAPNAGAAGTKGQCGGPHDAE